MARSGSDGNAPIISSRENEHNYGEAGKGGDEQIEKVNNTLPPRASSKASHTSREIASEGKNSPTKALIG